MATYFTLDPEDFKEMLAHIDDPQELDFNDDYYLEIQEGNDEDGSYYGDDRLDEADALVSAGWGTDEDYDYFVGGDEY